MERNTLTTLGLLRIGDRFTYPKRVDVWQVMSKTSNQVFVNQISPFKNATIHQYDEMKRASTQIKFIRHTKPLPGEEVLVKDLTEGDMFHFADEIEKDFVITKPEFEISYWMKWAVAEDGECRIVDDSGYVVFVGRKEEVKA
ncbi:MAG: hypothetical protein ACJ749_17945 [Flavisolibacter sp.]|jgi:hypothetical protein